MAIYPLEFPDGTPYPVIPAGTTTVNVSTSSQLSAALSSAVAGQRIVLANGTYSGSFTMSGKTGTASSGISIEAANTGGASFASGSTFRITDCAYVTVKGLLFGFDTAGDTFQFRGASHHCRITRCTFGPGTHAASTAVSTMIFVGDDCYHVRIDHNEIRNKGTSGNGVRVYGSFAKVEAGQGSSAGCRWVRIDHNVFRAIKPEVGNDKEPVRYGVSTMSRTVANGVIERNVFFDCACEPEIISVKMGRIRTTGNTILRCAGGPVIRHGTNSIMADNYIVDRANTVASAGLQSGGIRFYDSGHVVSYNYIDGTIGQNFQDPLLLDTGDAEGSSTNLSAHWRVIGAMVERNVLVNVPRGITIGDNYSSAPSGCTIRDNLVVDADTGTAVTQRIAPASSTLTNNTYFATTTAAAMVAGTDTIWRKADFGPRVTYLALADVGPAADTGDTDGTGAELAGGGTTPTATPAGVLNIGTNQGQNHFQLQYATDGSTGNNITIAQLSAVAGGLSLDPYFKPVTNVDGNPAVQFQVRADSATTSGSSTPRSELRETNADGSEMAFDAMVGEHRLHTRVRITHLPAADPEVVVAQLHNGVTGDRISVRTQLVSGQIKLLCRINGTQVLPRFSETYVAGTEFEVDIRVRDGGAVEVFYDGSTSPTVTGQLVSTGSASWYWKVGAYAQFDETTVAATEYVSVEHRDLLVTHPGPSVSVGPDLQVVTGQLVTITAIERNLPAIQSRRWTVVSSPTPPDPGGGDPGTGPDLTTAAGRLNWGTPLPQSDEFNYSGPPDSAKWALPGSDWAGHAGNGRRRPERQVVDGGKLVMTGLRNGDTGWMRQRVDLAGGRWEARLRAYPGAPSAGEPDDTSNGNDYHVLLLIWPESNSRQNDGEYDFVETNSPGGTTATAFIHFPHPGTETVQQRQFNKSGVNQREWHNYALEYRRGSSGYVRGFIDGVEWFNTTGGANDVRRDIQDMPAGHLCIQLDNFDGTNQTPATMEVEWVRTYAL